MPANKYPPSSKPTPNNQDWLSLIAQAIVDGEPAKSVILELRDEFDLLDPYDLADRNHNLTKPRGAVRLRTAELLREAVWPEDKYHVHLLGYFFAPERVRQDILSSAPDNGSATADHLKILRVIADLAYLAFTNTEIPPLFAEFLIDLTSTYAIEGYLKPPRELPSWFTGNVFEFPFVIGERVIIAIATRFADIDLTAADLKDQFKTKLRKRKRLRPRKHPERDMWISTEYHHIKQQLPERQAQIAEMARILDIHEDEAAEATTYDELLRRFQNSAWADQLARYDLDASEGRTSAKGFLRVVVHRTQQEFKEIIQDLPEPDEH